MTRLKYTFKTDELFKLLFSKNQDLLQKLVAELLEIEYESIEQFDLVNPEIYPEYLGDKYCKLDINMILNGQRVDLEVQVRNEGDFPERSLYYWARDFSSALTEGADYTELPRTIVISIVAFELFDCKEFHYEFQALEVTRHSQLTDKMCLHYYELPKLPDTTNINNTQELWLKLFKAETEEEIHEIEALEVPIMSEAVEAYRRVLTSSELREIERVRSKARHDEAQAMRNIELKRDKHWQGIVAKKDTALEKSKSELVKKDTALAEKDARIAELEAKLRTQNDEDK